MLVESIFCLLKDIFFFAGYINGSKAFPEALSSKEEKKYIELYRSGDETAKNVLIERNLRLVAHIAKKYSSSGAETDDLISVGTIGLIKGVNTYKFDKGTGIATYAARCIENEMLMYLRTVKRRKNDISLSEPIGTDKDGNSISLIDILCSDDTDIPEKVTLKVQIEKLYGIISETLGEREKTIIELRYGLYGKERLTQMQTANLIGISRSYVSRIEKKAIEKLAKKLKS